MTIYTLAPDAVQRFVDSNGVALSGGKLFTYAAGTTTKLATYTTSGGNVANTNPIILNTRGEASIWISASTAFKFVLAPATDSDPPTNPIWTQDNISTVVSTGAGPTGATLIGLTTNTTWYVNPLTGSDTNSGLSPIVPFQTIVGAYAKICSTYLFQGFSGTLQLAAGTYPATTLSGNPIGIAGSFNITGDTTTPTNCVLSTAVNGASAFLASAAASINLAGVQIKSTGTGGNGLVANTGGLLFFSSCDFGACTNAQIFAAEAGTIVGTGNFTVSGAAARSISAGFSASISIQNVTITITGTPAFSVAFAEAVYTGTLIATSITFSGSATGPRYNVAANGVINTNGGGATYFPGNSGGSTATGGQYL